VRCCDGRRRRFQSSTELAAMRLVWWVYAGPASIPLECADGGGAWRVELRAWRVIFTSQAWNPHYAATRSTSGDATRQ
jgi:hypothetical protein